jgi:hypothetical protein
MSGKTRLPARAIERKPAATIQRSAAAASSPSPARALQQRLGNQGAQALVSRAFPAVQAAKATEPLKSSVAAEQLSSPIPAQVSASGDIPVTPPQKETPTPSASKIAAPSSKAAPPSPSSATATQPSTSKPAARPAIEGPGQATIAPRGPKAVAGGPGGKAGGPAIEAPSARSAITPAITAVHHRAAGARKHSAPGVSVASAQAAAISPQVEQKRAAATQTVTNLDAAKVEEVRRNEFKAKLKQAIEAATPKPKTESQAEDVMKNGAGKASGTLRSVLATERDAAAGPMKSAAATEVPVVQAETTPAAALQSEPIGPPPAPVSAAPVVPASLPPERLDYSADRASADQVMAENDVTKEQLQEGNDPAFGPTIAARSSAEKHEATAEAKYRQGESKVQDQAHTAATLALAKDLAGMHGVREQQVGKVVSQQLGTRGKDAQERQRITDTINGIKDKTRTDVEAILASMETEASNVFEAGLKRAEEAYEDTFEEAKGGVGTWLTTWGSDWEKLIENSLGKARTEYLHQVDLAIDEVSTCVDGKLKAAKQRVATGRKEVDNFVSSLDASVKQFGEEALQAVSADFDTMGSDIDQRRDGLINKLTEQYKASYERMSAREDKLREENKSLWQRVYDATVGLIKKIIEFKNMLLSTLGKAAAVIGDIIAHPIRFLGNLVSGVMQGLKNFMSKLPTYLIKGLMDWLFGALAGAGLQLPDKFDLQGIISIVLQILGLTYANFRARAVAIVGEPIVAGIEKTAEVFKVILTEGVPGLWRFIKEQLANLKSMVLDAIFDYIKEKVIMAGITWIIGLLNPASAFFKACKAIYDIVMFFITRGRQIMALVNAVIDAIAAIAKGSIGVAAGLVENALAKAIPVAIGFLASLLGLGDPSKPVREFIEKARAPVNKAIDWVINLAVKGVKAVGNLVKGVFGKKDKQKKDNAGDGEIQDVKSLAAEKLATKLGNEASANEARDAAQAVLLELQPAGLNRLEVIVDQEGGFVIRAQASPIEDLFRLLPSRGRGFAVRMAAKVFLAGEQAAWEGTTHRTKFVSSNIYDLRRRNPVVATYQTAALEPPSGQPQSMAFMVQPRDNQSLIDRTLKDTNDLQSVEFVAGNTGESMYMSNESHAEEQFVDWYEEQPEPWRARVRRIEIHVTHSPCGNIHRTCTNSLARILKPNISPLVAMAAIRWVNLWIDDKNPPASNTSTTPQDVVELEKAGWRVMGPSPSPPGTEEARQHQMRVERKGGKDTGAPTIRRRK